MNTLAVAAIVAAFFVPQPAAAPALAQEWSSSQQEVWAIVVDSWELDMNEQDWVTPYVHADSQAWGDSYPAPRGRDATTKWSRFTDEHNEELAYELFPLKIVVHGDMALVHYFASVAFKNPEGEMTTEHYRQSDVMVNDGGWKFIGWHGSKVQ